MERILAFEHYYQDDDMSNKGEAASFNIFIGTQTEWYEYTEWCQSNYGANIFKIKRRPPTKEEIDSYHLVGGCCVG